MARTCGRCKGDGQIYGKLSVWDMVQGRGSNYGYYDCPVCSGSGLNPNWEETFCKDCGTTIEYHVDWERIPDLCPDCREHRKNLWQEKSCKNCGATIRYNVEWNNIPEYCKDCNQWQEKPCQSCGNPVRYKIFWENLPNLCQSCKDERKREREEGRQRRDRDFSERRRGGSSEPNGPNEAADAAARKAGLNDYQVEKFHEELQPYKGTLSYREMVDFAYDIKRKFKGYR